MTKKFRDYLAETINEGANDLQSAYDKVYAYTDKLGDRALEKIDKYAPKFSQAMDQYGEIEDIVANSDKAQLDVYMKELEAVRYELELDAGPYGEDVGELARIRELSNIDEETYDGDDFYNAYGELWFNEDDIVDEAEYQGRKVQLGKPMRGDVKKFKVYVKNPKGNVVKVNFGDPNMKIKKSNPARRRSFRARHNCDNPGPRHKARYWSCRKW